MITVKPIVAPDEEDTQMELIKATDRCDSCNAAAKVRVVSTKTGLFFLLCAHHARLHKDALLSAGDWIFGDVTGKEIKDLMEVW